MDLYTLAEEVNQKVAAFLAENAEEVESKELGIDQRACYKLWKASDCIVIRKSDKGRFNYYAGGEYVSADDVTEIGDYIFYSAESSRVQEWLGMAEEEVDPLDDFNYVGSRHHY